MLSFKKVLLIDRTFLFLFNFLKSNSDVSDAATFWELVRKEKIFRNKKCFSNYFLNFSLILVL